MKFPAQFPYIGNSQGQNFAIGDSDDPSLPIRKSLIRKVVVLP